VLKKNPGFLCQDSFYVELFLSVSFQLKHSRLHFKKEAKIKTGKKSSCCHCTANLKDKIK